MVGHGGLGWRRDGERERKKILEKMRKNDCVQQQQPLHTTTSSSSQMKLLEPYIVRYWFWEIEAVLLQIRQDRDWTDWIQLHHWALLSLALRRAVAGHTAASNRSQHLSNLDQADLSLFLSQTHRTWSRPLWLWFSLGVDELGALLGFYSLDGLVWEWFRWCGSGWFDLVVVLC